MRSFVLSLGLVLLLPAAAMAQPLGAGGAPVADADAAGHEPHSTAASNLTPSDTNTVAPSLPAPDLSVNAKPSDFLRAARGALATGRTGEAQQSLEMAESRTLDRSVPLGQTGVPSENPTVAQISEAMRALANNDREGCIRLIEAAIASATAQGL